MNLKQIQQERINILQQLKGEKPQTQTTQELLERFRELLALDYDVDQLWAERAELIVVLDDMDENKSVHANLLREWLEIVHEKVERRLAAGEVPKIFRRIEGTLEEWGKLE